MTIKEKSTLAKLLATENISVEYSKISTAAFNPKTRTLYCPIWKDMSNDLHDLLLGHEVGHAHETPAEGWHDAVCEKGLKYKGFLNVIEDARIEKKIKRRYPGLKKSFRNGFKELMDKKFFGDCDDLQFIDKVNLITKSDYTLSYPLNQIETSLLRRVANLETWEDVLKVTEDIWNYSKVQKEQEEPQSETSDEYENSNDDNESDEESLDTKGNESLENEDSEDDGFENQNDFFSNEPECKTDEAYRKNEQDLLDPSSVPYRYIKIPTPNLENIVTPVKRVQEVITMEMKEHNENVSVRGVKLPDFKNRCKKLYKDFKTKNGRYISLLAKEFEMRKAATKFSKNKTSTTGDIDINKIYSYQIDDNIFKKITKVTKGKSHGLMLLLDKSGSMGDNMYSSWEQILILALFCKKVNIPFQVYGFGNLFKVRRIDYPESSTHKNCFSKNVGELSCGSVFLREYLNSSMNSNNTQKAIQNILLVMQSFSKNRFDDGNFVNRIPSESLSATPLTESLIAMKPILQNFKKKNNLDIVNTVIVHDGDADTIWQTIQMTSGDEPRKISNGYKFANEKFFVTGDGVTVPISQNKTNLGAYNPQSRYFRSEFVAVSEWLQKVTGINLIGFYISNLSRNRYLQRELKEKLFNDEVNKFLKSKRDNEAKGQSFKTFNRYKFLEKQLYLKYIRILRNEKCLESQLSAYKSFYFIPDENNMTFNNETIEDIVGDSKITKGSLTRAFKKLNKSKQLNRVLVNKFIDNIAI